MERQPALPEVAASLHASTSKCMQSAIKDHVHGCVFQRLRAMKLIGEALLVFDVARIDTLWGREVLAHIITARV